MDKALAIMDRMEPGSGYEYKTAMARDVEKLVRENWPGRSAFLAKGTIRKSWRDDFRDLIFSHLQACGAYRWLGLGSEFQLMQWQYKSFVKRAGAAVLEQACMAFSIDRSTVINAIFSNDWQSLDEIIRYYFLDAAVDIALDDIQLKGAKK